MLKIRAAKLEDLHHISRLEKTNNVSTNENFKVLFKIDNANEKCRFFVAEKNGKIVGYSRLHIYKWNNSAYIVPVLVDIAHRREGIATHLLKTMEDFARENKARVMIFDTAHDNVAGLQLFFKNGFKVCGYNDKLYPEAKTAIYLAKELRKE